MSKNFQKIKRNYDRGIWAKEMVYNVVGLPKGITAEEYELIVGEPYEPEE